MSDRDTDIDSEPEKEISMMVVSAVRGAVDLGVSVQIFWSKLVEAAVVAKRWTDYVSPV